MKARRRRGGPDEADQPFRPPNIAKKLQSLLANEGGGRDQPCGADGWCYAPPALLAFGDAARVYSEAAVAHAGGFHRLSAVVRS